jgi:hypothetical protein
VDIGYQADDLKFTITANNFHEIEAMIIMPRFWILFSISSWAIFGSYLPAQKIMALEINEIKEL